MYLGRDRRFSMPREAGWQPKKRVNVMCKRLPRPKHLVSKLRDSLSRVNYPRKTQSDHSDGYHEALLAFTGWFEVELVREMPHERRPRLCQQLQYHGGCSMFSSITISFAQGSVLLIA